MANRRLDHPLRSRHHPRRRPAGRRYSGPGGSHSACAVRLPRPFRALARPDAGMARRSTPGYAPVLHVARASRPCGCPPARRSGCGPPSTGCRASTSFGWRRALRRWASCVWPCSRPSGSIGSRPASQRVVELAGRQHRVRIARRRVRRYPARDDVIWSAGSSGRRLARSSGEAVQRRRGSRA